MSEKKIKAAILGSAGKMGQEILSFLNNSPGLEEIFAIDSKYHREDHLFLNVSITPNLGRIEEADVAIDFSSPEGTAELLKKVNSSWTKKKIIPLVIGTTGHSKEQSNQIELVSQHIPIVMSNNFSLSVNMMFKQAEMLAAVLGPDWDVEIIEAHHNQKKDAPSGTAKKLAEVIAKARGQNPKEVIIFGRPGLRLPGEIGISSIRAGGIIGEHMVIFARGTERLELTSLIGSRADFARGAVEAAHWVINQKPGLYSMMDVLGLK